MESPLRTKSSRKKKFTKCISRNHAGKPCGLGGFSRLMCGRKVSVGSPTIRYSPQAITTDRKKEIHKMYQSQPCREALRTRRIFKIDVRQKSFRWQPDDQIFPPGNHNRSEKRNSQNVSVATMQGSPADSEDFQD